MKSIILVIDGFGVGYSEDAEKFGDVGANTYGNLRKARKFTLPNLAKMGLDNIVGLDLPKCDNIIGKYGRLREKSINKDTLTGHWEMMGIVTKDEYQAFPNYIEENLLKAVHEEIGETLCNHSASGIQVIEEFGQEHLLTKKPILYSSIDSVLQLAVHNSVWSEEKLYEMCKKVRQRMSRDFKIQRIIARPFATDDNGKFYRTKGRKDFAMDLPHETLLDEMNKDGYEVIGVGKIAEIFNFQGITKTYKTANNEESINKTLEIMQEDFDGVVFVNLVDTDMLYGHRNDIDGYIGALKRIDKVMPTFWQVMNDDDLLIITGDHGNDPTTDDSNHTREFTPLLLYQKGITSEDLGTLDGFFNVGKIAYNFIKNGGKLC